MFFLVFCEMEKNYILTAEVAEKKLLRMAFEIVEHNSEQQHFILAGIRESGTVIARNIRELLRQFPGITTDLITISLDKKMPADVILSEHPPLDDQFIIVIDDVANSGKTLLYAPKPFLDFHPKKIQSLLLVDRTHKAFPVKPDFIGLSIATTLQEHIYVECAG